MVRTHRLHNLLLCRRRGAKRQQRRRQQLGVDKLKVEDLLDGNGLDEFCEGGSEACGTVGTDAGGEGGVGVFVAGNVEGVEDETDCEEEIMKEHRGRSARFRPLCDSDRGWRDKEGEDGPFGRAIFSTSSRLDCQVYENVLQHIASSANRMGGVCARPASCTLETKQNVKREVS